MAPRAPLLASSLLTATCGPGIVEILALGLLTANCGPGIVEIQLPARAETKSMLVILEHGDRVDLWAVDAKADGPQLPGIVDYRGEANLYALLYREPLETFGLTAGAVFHDPDGVPPPAADAILERAVRGADSGAWDELTRLPPRFEILIPPKPVDRSHCLELQTEVFDLGTNGRVLAAWEDGDAVYGINLFGRTFRVTEDGVEEDPRGGPGGVSSSTKDPSGIVWLGDGLGQIWRGTSATGFELVSARPHAEGIRWLDTSDPGAPFELFALSAARTIDHLSNGTWQSRNLDGTNVSQRYGGVQWLRPGSAAFSVPLESRLDIIDDGRIQRTEIDKGLLSDLSALTRRDDTLYGVTGFGYVLRFEAGVYVTEVLLHDADSNYTIIPFAEGLLIPSGRLRMHYYRPGLPTCPAVQAADLGHAVWKSVPWGPNRAVLFTSPSMDWDLSDNVRVVVVRGL